MGKSHRVKLKIYYIWHYAKMCAEMRVIMAIAANSVMSREQKGVRISTTDYLCLWHEIILLYK